MRKSVLWIAAFALLPILVLGAASDIRRRDVGRRGRGAGDRGEQW